MANLTLGDLLHTTSCSMGRSFGVQLDRVAALVASRVVTAEAAGVFRRTPIERVDQRIAWERTDQAFFAAGACHILAWVCRDSYPDRPIEIAGVRMAGDWQVFHVYALWNGWAFDHSGWNPEPQLLAVNTAFEGRPLESVKIVEGLAEFCETHHSRMPHQYWQDPVPRARDYLSRYTPPWTLHQRSGSWAGAAGVADPLP